MRDERTASQTSVRDEDGGVAGLGGILITHELYRRGSRPPDHAAESRALAALAETMASSPKALIQRLVETALELCEPCLHLQKLTRPGIIEDLVHRAGINADVLTDGTISVGDPLTTAKGEL